MELVVDNRQEILEIENSLIETLEKVVQTSLSLEGWDDDYEVSLSLVDNKEMQQLNTVYRGKDYATDVLSFPMVDDISPIIEEKVLGDIVISVEKALEQAKEYGHSLEREMAFLTAHSMFHLMGYDHMNEEDEREMREKEEAVLQSLGITRK